MYALACTKYIMICIVLLAISSNADDEINWQHEPEPEHAAS